MSILQQAAAALLDGWQIQGSLQPLGEGLINDTFLAEVPDSQALKWVLQRINAEVFPDPGLVMDNVARVVRHVRRSHPELVAGLVATAEGEDFFVDAEGDCWRLWEYVANAETLQEFATPGQSESAGQAFARLQNALADLPGPRLRTPIPGFMQMSHYLAALDAELGRQRTLQREAENARAFIAERHGLAAELQQPTGYVHGDCKVNNLLFRSNEACCVLDLDTVMYGHWGLDFGDLVRSGADVGGRFSLVLYEALARGFVSELATPTDEHTLLVAPRYIGLMLGIRFLSDHLVGDRYFRVRQRGDNLTRALAQLDLVRQMEVSEVDMRDILQSAGLSR